MKNFSFDPFGNEFLVVKFNCNNCCFELESEEILIPSPAYTMDTTRDSQIESDCSVICNNCKKQFDLSIYSSYSGGEGSINNLPYNYEIEVIEFPEEFFEDEFEAICSNTSFFQTFTTEIGNLKELNQINIENSSCENTLRRQIYVGVISTMETYLSDAFINTTLNSKEFTKQFVFSFHKFKEMSFPLNKLYETYENIEKICRNALGNIIFHRLKDVKGMYKDSLNVDFGEMSVLFDTIKIRHHLVHRNGKTTDGTEVEISKIIIEELISDIVSFIENIDEQIERVKTIESIEL